MTVASRPLLILGSHMLAMEMADLVSEIDGWHVEGFVENLDRDRCASTIEGLPVHWIDDVGRFAGTHHAVCGISTTHRVGFIEQASAQGLPFATLVHPMARVSKVGADASLQSADDPGAGRARPETRRRRRIPGVGLHALRSPATGEPA